MKRTKSSNRWLEDHENDAYVQRARREGYRSRACYKLLEIDEIIILLGEEQKTGETHRNPWEIVGGTLDDRRL